MKLKNLIPVAIAFIIGCSKPEKQNPDILYGKYPLIHYSIYGHEKEEIYKGIKEIYEQYPNAVRGLELVFVKDTSDKGFAGLAIPNINLPWSELKKSSFREIIKYGHSRIDWYDVIILNPEFDYKNDDEDYVEPGLKGTVKHEISHLLIDEYYEGEEYKREIKRLNEIVGEFNERFSYESAFINKKSKSIIKTMSNEPEVWRGWLKYKLNLEDCAETIAYVLSKKDYAKGEIVEAKIKAAKRFLNKVEMKNNHEITNNR